MHRIWIKIDKEWIDWFWKRSEKKMFWFVLFLFHSFSIYVNSSKSFGSWKKKRTCLRLYKILNLLKFMNLRLVTLLMIWVHYSVLCCAFLSFGEKITLCWLNCSFKFIFMVFGGFDVFFTSGYLFCYNNRTFLPQVKKNRMFESSKRMVYEKKHATDFFHLPQHTYTRTQTSIMFLAL